jgi:hypothetical protein
MEAHHQLVANPLTAALLKPSTRSMQQPPREMLMSRGALEALRLSCT